MGISWLTSQSMLGDDFSQLLVKLFFGQYISYLQTLTLSI